jgi:hypothetical protein
MKIIAGKNLRIKSSASVALDSKRLNAEMFPLSRTSVDISERIQLGRLFLLVMMSKEVK